MWCCTAKTMDEKLRHEIDEVDWNNSESVINFYEANKLYFDNYDLVNNIDSIIEIKGIKI